ncbi:MAG: 1-acyl-sn-glycerol-3-phosphate acyltransferase [Bacteroidales bacterium]|nr:1-acyl-sn-glycerol-3-phosphate acyltransferase [Bacteroidales bacterium]
MQVNVRQVLKDKNPALARWIPGILLRWLEHIIHQKEINDFLQKYGHLTGISFCNQVIDYFNVKTQIHFLEPVPPKGRYVFVSNHPLGGFDGIILMKLIAENFGNVRVPVNDILMNIPQLKELFIPINKHGHQSKAAASAMDETFRSDLPILTFPAGLCSRKINGQIRDLEWKKNFIVKSIETQRDIVPIFFEGRNSNFFYNLSNLRKRLGVKANIEMIFLVDEMFRHRNKTFRVYIGKIIPYTSLDNSQTPYQWAQEIRKHIYNIPLSFSEI